MTTPRKPDPRAFRALEFSVLDRTEGGGLTTVRYSRGMPAPIGSALMVVAMTSGSIALFALFGVFAAATDGQRAFFAICGVVGLALIAGVVLIFRRWDRRHGRRLRAVNGLLPEFAAANHLSYRPESVVDGSLPPAAGQDAMVSRVDNRLAPLPESELPPFEIGHRVFHKPTPPDFVPSEKQPYPVSLDYGWYVAVPLPRKLPHLALLRREDRADSNLDQAARYSMGVEFDATFTLLCPPGYERDALYLFTPDVLAAMLDDAGAAHWGAEVLDDRLFFRFPTAQIPRAIFAEDVRRAFLLVERTAAELAKQAENYADSRVGARTLDLVADPGRRLRTRVRPTTIVAAVGLPLLVLAPSAMFMVAQLAIR